MGKEEIKLAIVDDEELVVKLLEQFLSTIENYKVVITAFDGSEFIEKLLVTEEIPDIALIDLRMKNMNGIETVTELKKTHPEVKVITISSHYKTSFMGYMMKVGVNAFIPKGVAPKYVVDVIESVNTRGYYFTEEQIDIMRNQISSSAPEPVLDENNLTTREQEILELICHQYTAQEIADKLNITKKTVEGHRTNLFLKTGVKNLAGLVIYAIQNNLINLKDFNLSNTTT
ncbi:MAG: DNA-binding response regulator [Salinivirgaceae bacterium]|nr:MAG: DNA-binding response regulator [Salinivirgaceae bacterium]